MKAKESIHPVKMELKPNLLLSNV